LFRNKWENDEVRDRLWKGNEWDNDEVRDKINSKIKDHCVWRENGYCKKPLNQQCKNRHYGDVCRCKYHPDNDLGYDTGNWKSHLVDIGIPVMCNYKKFYTKNTTDEEIRILEEKIKELYLSYYRKKESKNKKKVYIGGHVFTVSLNGVGE